MEKQIGEILKTELTDEQKLTLINVIINQKKEEPKSEAKTDEIIETSVQTICYYKMIGGRKVFHRENGPAFINYMTGNEEYYYEGNLHRDGDFPAFIGDGGKIKRYYKHGVMTREGDQPSKYYYGDLTYTNDKGLVHRVNGPAYIDVDGTEKWYFNDKLHRDGDLPAIYNKDMTVAKYFKHGNCHRDGDLPAHIEKTVTKYCQNGEFHRDGDMPAIIYANGSSYYYKNGKLHRDGDFPAAIEPNGTQLYYKDNNLHRDGDMPAIITKSGVKAYYTNGVRTKLEYNGKVF